MKFVPEYENFTECYFDQINEVMKNPDYECSPRGMAIKEKLGASFIIKDPRNRLPYIPERKYSISYYCAEALWYFAGRNDVEWIGKYSPFWFDVTDNGSTVNSSYGSRIFRKHDRIDNGSHIQYERVLNELKNDRDSRRASFYLVSPGDNQTAIKDVGCCFNMHFFIRNNKLNQIVNMRSNDLILGVPYDISAFTLIQEKLANDLDVELGYYHHNASSLHIYERNFEVAKAVMNATLTSNCPSVHHMPKEIPVDKLIEFERKCQICQTLDELKTLYNSCNTEFGNYWSDWAKIFVGHRAKKLDKEFKKFVFNSFEFDGYRRFTK